MGLKSPDRAAKLLWSAGVKIFSATIVINLGKGSRLDCSLNFVAKKKGCLKGA
jgi:hypothetical protein